jgi:hypothetical protein
MARRHGAHPASAPPRRDDRAAERGRSGFTLLGSLWAARTLGPRGTVASWSTARTTRRTTTRPAGTAAARPAATTASFRASRRTAPWRAASSRPARPASLTPHLLGKLCQFIAVELPVAVGVERQGAFHKPLRARRPHPGAPSAARPTIRRSSIWRSTRATFPSAWASRPTLAPRTPLTRRAATGRAFTSGFTSGFTSFFTSAGPKSSRGAFARRPMLPGGMRWAKLLLVDHAVAVAIEAEESGRGIFDFFRIEPVVVVAIKGLAERIKRRRAGRASAELGRWAPPRGRAAAGRLPRRRGRSRRPPQRFRSGFVFRVSFHHPSFWIWHRAFSTAV